MTTETDPQPGAARAADELVVRPKQPRCRGRKANGAACGAFASKRSGYCSRHDEARKDEPRALALIRNAFRRDDPRGVKAALAAAIEDQLAGRISPNAAHAVASLVRTWLQAHDRWVLQAEVERLTEIARRAQGAGADGFESSGGEDDFDMDGTA